MVHEDVVEALIACPFVVVSVLLAAVIVWLDATSRRKRKGTLRSATWCSLLMAASAVTRLGWLFLRHIASGEGVVVFFRVVNRVAMGLQFTGFVVLVVSWIASLDSLSSVTAKRRRRTASTVAVCTMWVGILSTVFVSDELFYDLNIVSISIFTAVLAVAILVYGSLLYVKLRDIVPPTPAHVSVSVTSPPNPLGTGTATTIDEMERFKSRAASTTARPPPVLSRRRASALRLMRDTLLLTWLSSATFALRSVMFAWRPFGGGYFTGTWGDIAYPYLFYHIELVPNLALCAIVLSVALRQRASGRRRRTVAGDALSATDTTTSVRV